MRKLVLSRRDVVDLLTANGFARVRSAGGHDIYEGLCNGARRSVTVDQ